MIKMSHVISSCHKLITYTPHCVCHLKQNAWLALSLSKRFSPLRKRERSQACSKKTILNKQRTCTRLQNVAQTRVYSMRSTFHCLSLLQGVFVVACLYLNRYAVLSILKPHTWLLAHTKQCSKSIMFLRGVARRVSVVCRFLRWI